MQRFALIAVVAGLALVWIVTAGFTDPLDRASEPSDSLAKASQSADAVVVGRVVAKRDHRATDGGTGYDIRVRDTWKGPPAGTVAVRAGGWAYTLDLPVGSEVLLFLDRTTAFLPTEDFVPLLGPQGRPLVFLVREGQLAPAPGAADPGGKSRSLPALRQAIRSAEIE